VHVPPFSPVYPRWQRQAVLSVCRVLACPEFGEQAVQASEPVVAFHVDGAHAEQLPPEPVVLGAHGT
jgi:hypothetical protein